MRKMVAVIRDCSSDISTRVVGELLSYLRGKTCIS